MASVHPRALTTLPGVAGGGRRGPSEQQQQQRPRHCHHHRRTPGPGPSPAHGSALGPALHRPCLRPPAPAAARAATAATTRPAAAPAALGSHRPGGSQPLAPRALPPARPRPAGSRRERGRGTAEREALGGAGVGIRRNARAGVCDAGGNAESGAIWEKVRRVAGCDVGSGALCAYYIV